MNGLIPYEYTDKKISPWGGIRIIGSAIGVEHPEILESFMMSVILGAGNCTGAAQIRYDDVLREIFQWDKGMPSQCSLSRFFPKYDHDKSDEIFSELFTWWFTQMGQKGP